MARYLVDLNNGQIDEHGLYRLFGVLLTQSGVIQSGALTVSAQTTPDMTVKVAGDLTGHDIVFITSSGSTYHGWNTDNENVTITANASGVTKTDAIVAYADLSAGIATSNNPGALKFVAVRRSGSLTGNPTSTEIASAVSSNPYLVLAYVTVANGASSINSGNITDARTRAYLEADRLEPISGAQISSGTSFGQSNKQLLNFVPRTPPTSAYDFHDAGATGGWGSNTNLQPIVGNKAVKVLLYVEYQSAGTAPAAKISMAPAGVFSGTSPNGAGGDARAQVLTTQVTNVPVSGTFVVELSSTQRVDFFYDAAGGVTTYNINVLGWWEPASTV